MTPGPHDDDWSDDVDGLDALDFGVPDAADNSSDLDALSEYAPVDNPYDHSELDAVPDYTSVASDEGLEGFDDFDSAVETDEEIIPVIQATNPPDTVTCTVFLSGTPSHVTLDPKVTALTESQLADEIKVVADVATKKASALMHIGVVEMLVEQGMDFREAREFVETNVPFATPQQAGEAELALIARHSEHHD